MLPSTSKPLWDNTASPLERRRSPARQCWGIVTDRSFYDQAVLYGHEQGAAAPAFTAEWKSLDELAAGLVRLVPEGLAAFLTSQEGEECLD